MTDLSIVVPLYNEEDNVPLLHAAISGALADFPRVYEVVLVDDGSKDATFDAAVALVRRDPRVRVVKFRGNYGQTAAMAAGIREARGDIIVTMDGDLQNDPLDIPDMIRLIDEGHDIVVGWRKKRQDGGMRVFVSKVANRIMARLMGVAVRDSGCSLKAFRSILIKQLPMYGEMHRFIPALSRLAGARLAQVEVRHHPRQFGVSKYGFSRIYKVMLDIISIRVLLSYVRRPMAWPRLLIALVTALGIAAVIAAVVNGGIALPMLAIGSLLLSLGLFLLGWAVIGQMLASLSDNVSSFAILGAKLSNAIRHEGEER
ncbi:glycosyltransferase family 2 protein [Sphingobium bisphenolivorans]|uniref:glycosyltransferase family 2 protein n=1 Tax=Sphingobium bisphenolivorans TaxID=1335760 RepID=UPI0003A51B09|nr:glycosyltransferase family 2 protein [Sphingobium bisphenolivorans]